ncbi:TadE/TadG family type IV pilus assembly protein [Novosphingobium mangrovi (ex Hu et al. 2023)]|uniref:Pilus assembly protein n=1 Tax=Novosphingobium mangrovi (ex Hu et al. 2023) TaxID=2930094 RepID=A0ABT0AF97_9SPHN|nr:TadE/TadG family type IV pilus assembly protein [Novosphingobium mangrovi (ex Hu et al. 2023)]MCJ1961856.1 pilus assembly protein [Novosphingobium mangrovi (ex Hu et al. 2023)]
MRRRDLFQAWAQDRRGVAAVEFALVAPVMLLTIFGLFDLGYNVYTAEQLEGSIQKAARDSTIEGAAGRTSQLDERVREAVHAIAPAAELTFERTAYASFSDIGAPEDFTDVNGDGTCNAGEPFEDANGNGAWDASQGTRGQGSARDAVLYEVEVTYPRPFPVTALLGMGDTFTMRARTVLRNQPYETNDAPPSIGNCP